MLSPIVKVVGWTLIFYKSSVVHDRCLLYSFVAMASAVKFDAARSGSLSKRTELHFVNLGFFGTRRL